MNFFENVPSDHDTLTIDDKALLFYINGWLNIYISISFLRLLFQLTHNRDNE